jgi:hypothetical protein
MTDDEVVTRWREQVVRVATWVDPNQEYVWEGVWVGFVIGLGRPDLADSESYMRLGFPVENE